MRSCRLLPALLLLVGTAAGQDITTPQRYGVEEDLVRFPQQSPQQAMQSVAKLLTERRLDYLLAHLVDPAFVDGRVKNYSKQLKGPAKAVALVAFSKLVKEIDNHFRTDPSLPEELRRYGKEGVWEMGKNKASAKLPDVISRRVYLIEIKGRWYLQNQRAAG